MQTSGPAVVHVQLVRFLLSFFFFEMEEEEANAYLVISQVKFCAETLKVSYQFRISESHISRMKTQKVPPSTSGRLLLFLTSRTMYLNLSPQKLQF